MRQILFAVKGNSENAYIFGQKCCLLYQIICVPEYNLYLDKDKGEGKGNIFPVLN